MTTVKSCLNMINGAGVLSSDTLRAINETSALLSQIAPSIQEAYRVTSQIAASISPLLLETVRQAQEISRIVSPAILEWQETSAQLANLMTPAIQAAAETAARMQIELHPLLRELCDVNPSAKQFSKLCQEVSFYADNIEFSDDIVDEIGSLTTLEKLKAAQAVSEILAEPENWEQELVKSLLLTQERHPVFAKAIIWLLSAIIAIILNVAANTIYDTIRSTKLREEPTQDAPLVTIVNVSQTVNVIDDVPYYFQIEYTDSETGKIYTGWISKRSVQEHEKQADLEVIDTSNVQ